MWIILMPDITKIVVLFYGIEGDLETQRQIYTQVFFTKHLSAVLFSIKKIPIWSCFFIENF